jgi:hypothetical protein
MNLSKADSRVPSAVTYVQPCARLRKVSGDPTHESNLSDVPHPLEQDGVYRQQLSLRTQKHFIARSACRQAMSL